jgi:hypothetical protein
MAMTLYWRADAWHTSDAASTIRLLGESFAFGEGDQCASMSSSKYVSDSKTMSLEIATVSNDNLNYDV